MQGNGFSSKCVIMCNFKYPSCEKALRHWLQGNSFSPECVPAYKEGIPPCTVELILFYMKFVCHFNLIYPYILYFVNLLFGDLIKGTRPKLLLICLKNYHSLQFFNWWLQRCDFLVALKSHWLYGDHTPSWTVFIRCMRWDMYFAL